MVDLPLNSRYLFTDIVKFNNHETMAWWSGTSWINNPPAQTIVAKPGDRADSIAYQYLGSSDLWWAILYYNKVTDVNWPRPGDEVAIPLAADVLST